MLKYLRIAVILLLSISFISCRKVKIDEGVSLNLAKERKEKISDIRYHLHFDIPSSKSIQVSGEVRIVFNLKQKSDIILDFRGSREMINSVMKKDKNLNYYFENGHIVIPKKYTSEGENSVTIDFKSADGSLNRNNEFLYTLLVPDRASTVFPCFDQPDMRAIYQLSLKQPSRWTSISNGKIDSINYISDTIKQVVFKPTKPISTYLFAFAAGNFKAITKTVNGKTFTIYHRETDNQKLERNLPTLFNLHAQSVAWLENYTEISYPFDKLDFILIPGFQYSGMEHPGAIFYRDTRLLLNENPSINQQLSRANLIAHEVAHQWFGNLVTMRWFNDVWLKEVFAGFMADMIVNPQYPDVNHQLSFLLSHYPRAYSVDRTKGANPIVQNLENMLNAGTLYGDIIYHKAPIMMQQLEIIMGSEPFKKGVQEYLRVFSMNNANWQELVSILDKYTEINLTEWSEIWTLKTGRPVIGYSFDEKSKTIYLNSIDSTALPPMWIDISSHTKASYQKRVWLNDLPKTIEINDCNDKLFLINSSGLGYACFVPSSSQLQWMLANPMAIHETISRASNHLSLYEMFLENRIELEEYIDFLIISIEKETDSQIRSYLLNNLNTVFWRFTPQNQREHIAANIENTIWRLIKSNLPKDQRKVLLTSLVSIFTTDEFYSRLYNAWVESKILDINLSEDERTGLAYELMIRKPELYHTIAFGEIERLENPDRIAKFEFTLGAVSPNLSERITFFESLYSPENRKPEPWVVDALLLLHHPLRTDFSIRFLEKSLDMLPEIQKTGDIFFPKNWLDATLWGHSSPESIDVVKKWIEENPELEPNLKSKLLQSADMMFRIKQEE